MTIPFVDLLTKAKARLLAFATSKENVSPVVRIQKPSDQRLSKTVLPNTTPRPRAATDPLPAGPGLSGKPATPVSPNTVSFDPSLKTKPQMAISPEPFVERTIALEISEILDQLPRESVKPANSFDASRMILLKASELEKGMASGKPTVPLASIYQQAPEIFVSRITPGDVTKVSLPFTKVLEQFNKLQVRPDQEHDLEVPQLETPILKVTLEDTERFGIDIEPLETSPIPPVKVEPATAKTIAAAEPEPAVRSAAVRPKIPLRDLEPLIAASTPPLAGNLPSAKKAKNDVTPGPVPKKIPFHLPPNGTGAPASERVPASSGPPVPTIADNAGSTTIKKEPEPEPIVAKEQSEKIPDGEPKKISAESVAPSGVAQTPPRIPFKFATPRNDIRPKLTLVPGVEPKEAAPVTEPIKPFATNTRFSSQPNEDPKVVLSLQSLLSQIPPFQLNGSPISVPEDVRVIFPLALIEPQLASGRVVIPARTFQGAIPEAHRDLFIIDPNETPVALPLHEIVKHLPPTALRMRDDQEEATHADNFTTPFSIQADEDAKRFEALTATAQKAPPEPEKESAKEKSIALQTEHASTSQPYSDPSSEPKVAQAEAVANKGVEKQPEPPKLDARTAAIRAKGLPGVASCAITFADGLGLAGNIPAELAAEGLSAIAPSLLHKIDSHISDTRLGTLRAITLHCSEATLTFFRHGNICLTALHSEREDLSAETRDELSRLTEALSQTYPEVELSHVDH